MHCCGSGKVELKELGCIDVSALPANAEMKMWAGSASCAAAEGDDLAAFYMLAFRDAEA